MIVSKDILMVVHFNHPFYQLRAVLRSLYGGAFKVRRPVFPRSEFHPLQNMIFYGDKQEPGILYCEHRAGMLPVLTWL